MAEARQAIKVFEEHRKGVKLLVSDEGIEVSFVIPHPRELRQTVLRKVFGLRLALQRHVYPASPAVLYSTMILVVALVLSAGKDSWLRNGRVAWFLWEVGYYVIPFASRMPHWLYVGILAANASFFGLFLLMVIQRTFLRWLLCYRGFMYLKPKEKSTVVLAWGGMLKLLGGKNPMTFSFQTALPKLPLPSLRDTCTRYLDSVRALMDKEEFQKTSEMAEEFISKVGPSLQRYLYFKQWWSDNYVTDWWEQYVYLKGRSSLLINSNYYIMDFDLLPTSRQSSRAAGIVRQMMEFKQLIDREQLEPLLIQGIVPLCMHQYKRMFSTVRIPGREIDSLKTYGPGQSRHLAVLYKGRYYKMPLYRRGTHGKLLSAYEIQRQIDTIKAVGDKKSVECNYNMASLTADERVAWADVREKYFSEGRNKASISVIDSAVFMLILDEETPENWNSKAQSLFYGNGGNRWIDKSMSLVAFANGKVGLNIEHSWADAPVVAHLWEYTVAKETINDMYEANGKCKATCDDDLSSDLPAVSELAFDFTEGLKSSISSALQGTAKLISDIDLHVFPFNKYGKGFMKSKKMSPDAFIQMTLQLAYYRDSNGTFTQTYEASMTRLYRKGRTETVRPVTLDSKAFVESMARKDLSNEDRASLLQKACETHQNLYRNAMSGKGVDRHLFTLYCVSVGMGVESEFLNAALGRPWQLSTSQQPQQQTMLKIPFYKAARARGIPDNQLLSPGGGFGPVVDDGYGVSYMITGEDQVCFHVSSKKSSSNTDSKRFAKHISQSFEDIQALWKTTT